MRKIALRGNRFAFINGAGVIRAKDGRDTAWSVLNPDGRATEVVLDGEWIGAILDGNYHAKHGLNGAWTNLANGGDVHSIHIAHYEAVQED